MTLSLNATSNVAGAENAVTSSAEIDGVLILAAADANITYGGTTVQVLTRCGDGICSPGEPLQKNQDNTGKCATDCPFIIGTCDAPPASGVGDPTRQCGGNGVCNPSNLGCECYAGYAVCLSSSILFHRLCGFQFAARLASTGKHGSCC